MLNNNDLFIMKINELRDATNHTNPYNTLRISALLRQLLVDRSSLIHIVNRVPKLKIGFLICSDSTAAISISISEQDNDGTISFRNLFPATASEVMSVKLADFLALECGSIKNEAISVLELIKYVANDAGGVHASFGDWAEQDSKCAIYISTFRQKNVPVAHILLRQIAYIALNSLKELYDTLLPAPSLPFHYYASLSYPSTGAQMVSPGWAEFQPQHYLESKDIDYDLSLGFELHLVIRTPKLRAGIANGLIYEACSENGPLIQLIHTGERRIAKCIIDDENILSAQVPDAPHHHRNFHSFSFRVQNDGEKTMCHAIVNGQLFPGSVTYSSLKDRHLVYQSVGADQKGANGAEFQLRELCLTEPLSDGQFGALQQYFWKKLWPNN